MHQPDFTPRPGGSPDLLAPFGPGPWSVLPTALELGTRPDGSPDLMLELVRPADPIPGREDAYAVLDLRLEAAARFDAAVAEARAVEPAATVARAPLGRAWLRFVAPGDLEVPTELLQLVPLGYRGLTGMRWTLRLTAEGGALLRAMLLDGAMALRAVALIEVAGIAPRLRARVRASRADVAIALAGLAAEDGRVPLDAALTALRTDPGALGLELRGEGRDVDHDLRARVLCDLIVAELASLEPSAGPGVAPVLALPAALAGGVLDRDLTEPFPTTRPLVLQLDPLGAAAGAGAGLVHETVAPRFSAGLRTLRVMANVPGERVGLVALGARVAKDPAPPARVQAVAAAAELDEPADDRTVTVRLAPDESPELDIEPYAVIRAGRRARRLVGSRRRESGPLTLLVPEDFPLTFARLSATAALLALADVAGVCRHGAGAEAAEIAIALTSAAPACTLALPTDAREPELRLELRSVDGPGRIALPPALPADMVLDLSSMPRYGPQAVRATCRFTDGVSLHVIDVQPESAATGRPPQVLTFTPAQPERTISWFAASPFSAGFRHRPHPTPGAEPAPWSDPHPPFEPLELIA